MNNISKLNAKSGKKLNKDRFTKYSLKFAVSTVRWIFIAGMCFVVLFPFFKQIVLSVMDSIDLYDATVKYIPKTFTTENYVAAWNQMGGLNTFTNTLLLTTACSVLIVISSTIVGYGLARFKFKLNGAIFALVIFAMIIPADLTLLPRYKLFFDAGLINVGQGSLALLVFAATCTGFKCSLYIFLMRQFFKGQPHELEEAAYVDGAGPLQTFIRIMIPGAVGMMVTVFLFSFVWQWLDSTFTSLFMQNAKIYSTQYGTVNNIWSTTPLAVAHAKNAAIIIIIAPLVLLYVFTQRFFVESISRSGLVG